MSYQSQGQPDEEDAEAGRRPDRERGERSADASARAGRTPRRGRPGSGTRRGSSSGGPGPRRAPPPAIATTGRRDGQGAVGREQGGGPEEGDERVERPEVRVREDPRHDRQREPRRDPGRPSRTAAPPRGRPGPPAPRTPGPAPAGPRGRTCRAGRGRASRTSNGCPRVEAIPSSQRPSGGCSALSRRPRRPSPVEEPEPPVRRGLDVRPPGRTSSGSSVVRPGSARVSTTARPADDAQGAGEAGGGPDAGGGSVRWHRGGVLDRRRAGGSVGSASRAVGASRDIMRGIGRRAGPRAGAGTKTSPGSVPAGAGTSLGLVGSRVPIRGVGTAAGTVRVGIRARRPSSARSGGGPARRAGRRRTAS